MSFNGVSGSSAVISAANYLRSKGGVATVSAGNTNADQGYAQNTAFTVVSATAQGDARSSFSSFGAYVDVAAPGSSIYTTNIAGTYSSHSGTSYSAPLTAGIYALIFSANPALTPTQADNILFSTTDDLGTAGWDMYYGHGRVNAARAVAAALAAVGTRDTVPPSVPGSLRSTGATSNSISLAWNASTDDNSGVTGYALYRNGTKIATVAGTSYTNTGLTSNTAYTYTVRAEDGAGNVSADSNTLSVSTTDISFGISSYSVTGKTSSSATVAVSLTKPGTVTVKYGTTNTNLNLSAQSGTAATSHAVPLGGLTANTTYYYQVVATDSSGTVVTSSVSSFKTNKAAGGGKPRR
jgi:chitodextrinase